VTLPLVELSTFWTITSDILAWLVIHLGVSYGLTRMPARWFSPEAWLFAERRWERGGVLYDRLFRVKQWKSFLPDGAALFRSGFRKKALTQWDQAYLERFLQETCRGELTHWITFLWSPLFFLWNLPFVGVIMIAYALVANAPCVITQRYNRSRFRRVLRRITSAGGRR
jgi:glycosyl-4,4'-diaponeurosporenoate acyltransferase